MRRLPSVTSVDHKAIENALNLLVALIKTKLETGKQDASDYVDIIKDYDSMLAKHPQIDDDRMNILAAKGKLYLTLDELVNDGGGEPQIFTAPRGA